MNPDVVGFFVKKKKKGGEESIRWMFPPITRSIYTESKIDRKINLCGTVEATGWNWWYVAFAESGFTLRVLAIFMMSEIGQCDCGSTGVLKTCIAPQWCVYVCAHLGLIPVWDGEPRGRYS